MWSDKIASRLKLYFEKNDIKGKKHIAISDNCGGQNKNWNVVSFWYYRLSTEHFNEIEHVFLTTAPKFYKRKVWCYNLSVHSCGDNQGFFLWDEASPKRGEIKLAAA